MKEMEELSKMTTMRSCIENQIIYFTDDPSDKIYFLKKGKVKLSRYAADGREIIVAFLGPGEIFGELAISGQHQRVETAEATEESLICILSVPQMEMMLEKNPKFNLSVTKLIGLRLQKVESRLASLIFESSDQRITATARPTVSAVFSDLEKRNVIEYNRKRILVKDMNALK